MKLCQPGIILVMLLLAISAIASDQNKNFCPIDRDPAVAQQQEPTNNTPATQAPDGPPYWDGSLRIYVVEETSSMGWLDGDGDAYDFPFLAYAINSVIQVNDTTWDTTVTWDGYDYGYNNLQENNIAVQAVLFSQTDGLPEAAAMAHPGVPGSNLIDLDSGYTHTVFAEEGTATW